MGSLPNQISFSGLNVEYYNLALVAQTFFFGTYSVLIVLSTRILLRRGLKTPMQHVLFVGTLLMYTLSAAYWAYSVALSADRMHNYTKDVLTPADFSDDHTPVTKWNPLFNSLVLVNYVCSDAVVVWRAWIIASTPASRNYRKYLYITCFFLVLTFFSVTGTIVFQIIGVIEFPLHRMPDNSYLTYGTNVLQTMNLVFSLISNLIATAIVATMVFRHRKMLRAALAEDKKITVKILTLLAESGALYCISTVTTMIAGLIRLPVAGTLGDLYTPVNIQIAGAYPSVVLIIWSMQNETAILDSTPLRSILFPVQRSGSARQSHRSAVGTVHSARNPDLSRTDGTELGSRG
ncbi:hypothetical protein C8F04DRAFT_1232725 [Mycena alexandri]|uniref:Uncharacterized protein n=1 Tax=Mycena alexandri TaxID=1745969 RepID=A0AAD6T1B7_9AGAR|nr:hypothetical protein C8F04DRAFT_1232725 [Mycena alexandri]